MKLYKYVEVHDENTRVFAIDFIIRSHINLIQESAYFYREFFFKLAFGNGVFPHAIIVDHMIMF